MIAGEASDMVQKGIFSIQSYSKSREEENEYYIDENKMILGIEALIDNSTQNEITFQEQAQPSGFPIKIKTVVKKGRASKKVGQDNEQKYGLEAPNQHSSQSHQ